MDSKFFYAVPHIAKVLQVPISTAYKIVKQMAHNKIGGLIRVEEKDFQAYLSKTHHKPRITRAARF